MAISVNYGNPAAVLGLALAAGQAQGRRQDQEVAREQAVRSQAMQFEAAQADADRRLRLQQQLISEQGNAADRTAALGRMILGEQLGAARDQQRFGRDVWLGQQQLAQNLFRDQMQSQHRLGEIEYDYTTKAQQRVNELAYGMDAVDEMQANGQIQPEQAEELRWQLQQQMAGVQKRQIIQKPKPLAEQIQERVQLQEDGSRLIMQPDGKFDWKPAVDNGESDRLKIEQAQHKDFLTRYENVRKAMTVENTTDSGKIERNEPTDDEIRFRMAQQQKAYAESTGQPVPPEAQRELAWDAWKKQAGKEGPPWSTEGVKRLPPAPVRSIADIAQLPPGAMVRLPNGQVWRKPGG